MSRRTDYQFTTNDDAPNVWRSLDAKRKPEEHAERAKAEFPFGTDGVELSSPKPTRKDADSLEVGTFGRRGFMLFAGASAALAGCARRPVENIMPYTKQPEHAVPGISSHYATVYPVRGEAVGLLVESHEGRPTKVEGNPEHPASLGATDTATQAAIWDLYDPDRSQSFAKAGTEATAEDFDAFFADLAKVVAENRGESLRVLMAPTSSPTLLRLRDAVKAKLPGAKFVTWASIDDSSVDAGAKLAFDQAVNTVYTLDDAKVIVAVDSDLLGDDAGSLRSSRGYARGRKLRAPTDTMNRLYVVEPALSVTGMAADHRWRVPASECEGFLVALATELANKHAVDLGTLGSLKAGAVNVPEKWIPAIAKELVQNKGKGVVAVGPRQPARVHALAHAINWALANIGHTVQLFPAVDAEITADYAANLAALTTEMEAGKVETLLILGGNPVYAAPGDVSFADALKKVKNSIHLSFGYDETSSVCAWHAPESHAFESWGDHRSRSGLYAIQQPLIAPLVASRTAIELLSVLAGQEPKAHAQVRQTFAAVHTGQIGKPLVAKLQVNESQWKLALKKGLVSEATPRALGAPAARTAEIAKAFEGAGAKAVGPDNLEVTFAPDPRLGDGTSANNPWLLEVPCPISKLVWDNAAFISPATATALKLESGDVVRLSTEGSKPVEVAVFVQPGQGDNTLALTLGWGRQNVGRYGSRHGFDIQPLRTTKGYQFATGVKLEKVTDVSGIAHRFADQGKASEPTPVLGRVGPVGPFDGARYRFVQTQDHHSMEGRPLALDTTLDKYRAQPNFPQFKTPDPKVLPLWKKQDYSKGYKWGMTVDLNACLGCNACVIACQSENNVGVVGKDQVERGREMSWLRIDRYFVGDDENNPQVAIQPVACVHCEEAPCENVCPVNATEHSPEGLNDMAYNRCIGTRYCANNCPYKVRRFNFLNYHGEDGVLPETEKMHMNPNVTVRMRGVMEKCSYCVQRIQEAKIDARREGRLIKEGDFQVACQQACATEAIVFGNLNDPNSEVAKLTKLDRAYRLLSEIGTWPRTSYLGKIRNPNPELV